MKVSSIMVMAIVATALVVTAVGVSEAASGQNMTNSRLAQVLSSMLNLDMPADSDGLSDAELFEVQSNMLAERGVTQFVDAKPDEPVTRGMIADIIYEALVGPDATTPRARIAYLSGQGHLPKGGANEPLNDDEIINALNLPQLSAAVAEAYSSPGGRMRRSPRTGVLSSPANPAPVTPVAAVPPPPAATPASGVPDSLNYD
jgi:hypothetical protein